MQIIFTIKNKKEEDNYDKLNFVYEDLKFFNNKKFIDKKQTGKTKTGQRPCSPWYHLYGKLQRRYMNKKYADMAEIDFTTYDKFIKQVHKFS